MAAQVQEGVAYQEEGSESLEPLMADLCLFCFNNMETFRSEVAGREGLHLAQEYEELVDSINTYTNLDNPHYRLCIDKATNPGYIKVRCVDDPTTLSNSVPLEEPMQEEEDEEDTVNELQVRRQ